MHVILLHFHALLNVLIYDTWSLCWCSEKLSTCVYCCRICLLLDLKINISFEMQIVACTKDKKKCVYSCVVYSALAGEHVVCILGFNMGLGRCCHHLLRCQAVCSWEMLSERVSSTIFSDHYLEKQHFASSLQVCRMNKLCSVIEYTNAKVFFRCIKINVLSKICVLEYWAFWFFQLSFELVSLCTTLQNLFVVCASCFWSLCEDYKISLLCVNQISWSNVLEM